MNVPEPLLRRLAELITARMGLHFPVTRLTDLDRRLQRAAQILGFPDATACAAWMVESALAAGSLEMLADHLTTGETYFYRDPDIFNCLREDILPQLILRRRSSERNLRIWSAGCSSGEEPYSIAILLDRLLPDIATWHITLLATDISPSALQRATTGIYKEWSFRSAPAWLKSDYFREIGRGSWEIDSRIRRMVTFRRLNLVHDPYPSVTHDLHTMDIIFCRNVIMYFDEERQSQVVTKLHEALANPGWLIVSPSEGSPLLSESFRMVHCQGALLYKKQMIGAPAALPYAPPPPPPPVDRSPQAAPARPVQWNSEPWGAPSWEAEVATKPAVPMAAVARPESPGADVPRLQQARALYERVQYHDVIRLLTSTSIGGVPEAALLLARSYANLGELGDALIWSEAAVTADRTNPSVHYVKATVLQELGNLTAAQETLRQVIYLDPAFIMAHFAMANVLVTLGRREEAVRYMRNARELANGLAPSALIQESDGLTAGMLADLLNGLYSQER